MAKSRPWLEPAVFTGALIPLGAVVYRAIEDQLGANPIEEAINRLGLLALIFLILSLAPTPLKALFGWTGPLRVRRMLGLFAFFYATLHVATYAGLDQGLDFAAITADIRERPFILAGFSAWAILVPLSITSTDRSVRRLGFKNWKRLHRLAYLAAVLGVAHFILRVKIDLTEPIAYAGMLAILLFARLMGAKNQGVVSTAVTK